MRRFFAAGDMEDVGVVCMAVEMRVSGEFINRREGALRGQRSLRDLYTGFAPEPPDGRHIDISS